jgi:glutaredoxin
MVAAPSSASRPPAAASSRRSAGALRHAARGVLASCCIALLLLSACFVVQADGQLVVHVFTRDGCPHCERATLALARIVAARDGVELRRYDIGRDPAHRRLLVDVSRALGVEVGGVPFTLIGAETWTGYLDDATTGQAYERRIDACLRASCPDLLATLDAPGPAASLSSPAAELPAQLHLPLFGEVSTAQLSLPLITVLLAAIDGFNPCAMWVLVFLLGILAGVRDRRRMWLIGCTFVAASAAVYLLILGAWLQVFLWLGALPLLRFLMGGVALAAGAYYLRQFASNPGGVCHVTAAPARRHLLAKLRALVLQPGSVLALAGVVLLAVVVNAVELMCSAGVPAVFTHLLAQAGLSAPAYFGYLLLYVFVFMLDDLVVLALALKTLELTGLAGAHGRWASLLGALMLFAIAAIIFLRPGWLGVG